MKRIKSSSENGSDHRRSSDQAGRILERQVGRLADNHHGRVMSEVPQTDVSRPSALPTAKLHNRAPQNLSEQNSAEYLDNIENEWNKRVDTEIETLVDGMVDLVSLASVCSLLSHRGQYIDSGFPADWRQGQVPHGPRGFPSPVSGRFHGTVFLRPCLSSQLSCGVRRSALRILCLP